MLVCIALLYKQHQRLFYDGMDKASYINAKAEIEAVSTHNEKYYYGTYIKEQYKRFWDTVPDYQESLFFNLSKFDQEQIKQHAITLVKQHQFNISLLSIKPRYIGGYLLNLSLMETMYQVLSKGGSSFRITCASKFISVCEYRDHFNGTYTAQCPVYGECANITVQLTGIDYSVFQGSHAILDMINHTLSVCNEQVNQNNRLIPKSLSDDALIIEGVWLNTMLENQNDHIFLHRLHGHVLDIDNKKLCGCIMKYSKVILLGDSHMKFQGYYLRHICHEYDPHIVSRTTILEPRYAVEIMEELHMQVDILDRENLNNKSVAFLIEFGAWDITRHGSHRSIEDVIPHFEAAAKDFIHRISPNKNWKLVVAGTPSMPNLSGEGYTNYGTVGRSNEAVAVYNLQLKNAAKRLGIEFVDTFSITYPMYRNTPISRDHHYLRSFGNPPFYHTIENNVGKAVARTHFLKFCPHI